MVTASGKTHHWSREEYEQAVETGGFEGLRIELVDGVLCDMSPQSGQHATAVRKIQKALDAVLPEGFDVRTQMPLALSPDSEPEPDIAIVPGETDAYSSAHPTTAVLVVEIADSSLAFDRNPKKRLYGRAGIPEYWIVNLSSRRLEVYRDPGPDGYGSVTALGLADSVSPLALPGVSFAVENLFPKQ